MNEEAIRQYLSSTRLEMNNVFRAKLYSYARVMTENIERLYSAKGKELIFVIASSLEMKSELVEIGRCCYLIHDEFLGQRLALLTRFYYEWPAGYDLKGLLFTFLSQKFLKRGYYNLTRLTSYASAGLTVELDEYLLRTKAQIGPAFYQELFVFNHEICHFLLKSSNMIKEEFVNFEVNILDHLRDSVIRQVSPGKSDYEQVAARCDNAGLREELFCDFMAFNNTYGLASRLSTLTKVDPDLLPVAIVMFAESIYLLTALDLSFDLALTTDRAATEIVQHQVMDAGIRFGIRKTFLVDLIQGRLPSLVGDKTVRERYLKSEALIRKIDELTRFNFNKLSTVFHSMAASLLAIDEEQDVPSLGPFNRRFDDCSSEGIIMRDRFIRQMRTYSVNQ